MKIRSAGLLAVLIPVLIITGCSPRDKYERMLKRESESGMRHDSLFMGIYLGMTSKDFYTRCWDLNKKGLIRQGSTNTNVEYEMKELNHPAVMNFYPTFKEDKIYEMPVRFKYKGWAPWNKKLLADKLQKDVLHWYEKQYGKGFVQVNHPQRGSVYAKIDGNRRITIFKEDDLYVWAYFTDLSVEDVDQSTFRPVFFDKDTIQ